MLGFFVLWARTTGRRLDAMMRRRWRSAVVLGLVVALVLAVVVVRTEPATSGPHGLALAWAVLWRGIGYGAADGLLLSAFPILVVFAAAEGSDLRRRRSGTVAVGAVALLDEPLARPVAADVVWSVPTLVTLNPIGAPIAHAGLHVSAVLHSSETDVFLPPHR